MTTDPLIGRQLGNYRLERLLGRGGMAAVYYATDIRLNRPAAVKVIDAHFRARGSYAARFLQEARSVASWRHEHIVQIYYAGEEEGLSYFAMEYVDGDTLANILTQQAARGELLPPAEVLRYGWAIASALDYAHRKGVIHRDVKPLNVLISNEGRIVLADFGLALDQSQGSLGEVFGTAHYTAPEQARRSNAAVPQSDLYSLGVILYEMLTGVVPFDDPSPTSVALQQITLDPPAPRQINPSLSPAVESVLLRALSKEASARYPLGAALMQALEAALQPQPQGRPASPLPAGDLEPRPSLPSRAPQPTPTPLLTPRPARPWLPVLGLGVVLACLVIASGAAFIGLRLAGTPEAKIEMPASQPAAIPEVLTALPDAPSATVEPDLAPQAAVTREATASLPTGPPPVETLPPVTVTSTSPPTEAAAIPSPTLRYSDRRHFVLYYNEDGFYMLQTVGVGDLIGGVRFERLGADLQPLGSFNSTRWAEYSPSSLRNWCYRLEIWGAENIVRPPECREQYIATLHLEPGDSQIFWTPQEGSRYFRLVWRDEELVRCEISAGSCEVYLP